MNSILFISLLFGLQFFCWMMGKKVSKNLKGKDDYFLAGKNVRFFPLMMTFIATQVGGGLFLGAADEAYRFGWYVLLYPLGAALGLIVLGLGIGKKLAQFQVSTVAQILEVVYRSVMLRRIASMLSILSLFMVLVAQIIASRTFLFALGFNSPLLFIAFWSIIILYTVRGGLKAVIATDVIQAAFFSIVILFCFGFVFFFDPSSSFLFPTLEKFSLVSSKLSGWLLMPLLFIVIGQDMGQRCFSGGSPRIVSKASLWAGIFTMIISVIPVFFGILAKTIGLNIPEGASVLMTFIASINNPLIPALVATAILAAIISSSTSLINAISSNISNDFPIQALSKKENIGVIRGITMAISIGALISAFYFTGIVDVLIQSYALSVSCLFVPIFLALFKKRGNFFSALLSISFGALGFCLFQIFPLNFLQEICTISLSLLGYGIGEVMSRFLKRV